MAPAATTTTTSVEETAPLAVLKSQPVDKVEEGQNEITPLEAISHGGLLPGEYHA